MGVNNIAINQALYKLSQYSGTMREKIDRMVEDHVRYELRARRDNPLVVVDAGEQALGITLRSSTVAHVLLGMDGIECDVDEDADKALVGEDLYEELVKINERALCPSRHLGGELDKIGEILDFYNILDNETKKVIIEDASQQENYNILINTVTGLEIQDKTTQLLADMDEVKNSLGQGVLAMDSQRTGVYLNKYALDYATVVTAPVVYHYSVLKASLGAGGTAGVLDDPKTLTKTIGELAAGSDTLTLELELAVER
jgi:hypothetical protein